MVVVALLVVVVELFDVLLLYQGGHLRMHHHLLSNSNNSINALLVVPMAGHRHPHLVFHHIVHPRLLRRLLIMRHLPKLRHPLAT